MMGAERCAHAGMVRAIVRSELQWTWDELQQRHGELESIASDLQSRREE